MAKLTFYPLGNADCCLIRLDNDKLIVVDYADMRNANDPEDKRIALSEAFDEDIGCFLSFLRGSLTSVSAPPLP